MELKVGCDPEFFVCRKSDKKPVAALFAPGTKEKPHKLDKGAVQRDGVAMEFNIEPATTSKEFSENIGVVLEQCLKLIPDDLEPRFTPSVFFDEEYFDSLPDHIKELGCDPDYNARTLRPNPVPRQPGWTKNLGVLRTGAGHIHLGWTHNADPHSRDHMYDCGQLVQRLDTYFNFYRQNWDTDSYRATLYGANGAFRPKHYGLEYRVPSNAWLAHKELWPWLFESVKWVFESSVADPKKYNKNNITYTSLYRGWPSNKYRTGADRADKLSQDMSLIFGTQNAPKFPMHDTLMTR